jgi:site-specific recombinase XerD
MNSEEAVKEFIADLGLRGYSPHTQRAYEGTITNCLEFCEKDFREITTADVKRFLLFVKDERNCTLRTIHRHINALKAFFEYFEIDIVRKIRLPKVEKALPTFLTLGEMETLLNSIFNKRDLAIVRLLYASGLRVSELVKLNRDSFEENSLRVKSGKGKKDRIVYVDDGTIEIIEEYLNEREDKNKALFVNRRGKRLTCRSVELLVKKHAERAGIKKKVTPHTLRHTFATHLLQNNANIIVIQNLLGHASVATTQIYTHVTDEHKKETYMNSHPLSR